jgi:type I restriction enzyme, S subunit
MEMLLKYFSSIHSGGPAPDKSLFSKIGKPFIRAGSLEFLVRGISIENCEKIDDLIATEKGLKLYPKNSILFAKSGMSAKMGRVYLLPSEAYVVSHLAIIVPDEKIVNPLFVKYYFSNKPPFNLIKDDAYPSISLKDIGNIKIPLLDLETQDKIVAILEKVTNLIEKREKTITLFDDLMRASFLDIFGEPTRNTKGWERDLLGNHIIKIIAGSSYGGDEKSAIQDDELGVLKISSVTRGVFDPNEYKAVKKNIIKKKIVKPSKGDLLFSRANTMELVGATCLVDKDYDNLFLPDKLWKIEINEDVLKKTYLHFLLQSKNFKENFTKTATGSSGSMLNISMDKFRSLEIPIPPIEKQIEFERVYYTVEEHRKKHLDFKKTSDLLLKSLSQQAFSGKILYDIDVELEALINAIDLDKNDDENNIDTLKNDLTFLQRLIDKLEEQDFENPDQYEKAKHIAFRIMKEESNLIKQHFNSVEKKITLHL